jgi:hypothetical protein
MATKQITLRYAARCVGCGNGLSVGDAAEWESDSKRITCLVCAGTRGHLRDRLKPGIGITYKPAPTSQAAHNARVAARAYHLFNEREGDTNG